MPNLFGNMDGVECRACGATFAQPDKEGPFCKVCMGKFRYQFCGRNPIPAAVAMGFEKERKMYSEGDLNRWLARQLELNLIRMKRYGHSLRCEAITKQDQNKNAGYQCPRYATTKYMGRPVCKVHEPLEQYSDKRTENFPSRNGLNDKRGVTFIEDARDPYLYLKNLILEIASKDENFMNILYSINSGAT